VPSIQTSLIRVALSASLAGCILPAENSQVTFRDTVPSIDWTQPPDFDSLRLAYDQRSDLQDRCVLGRPLEQALEHAAQQRWRKLLALSGPWLQSCPIDLDFHALHADALAGLERGDEAELHRQWRIGLVNSTLRSGDGRKPESAYIVVSKDEAEAVIRALGLTVVKQLPARNGLDSYEVVSQQGARSTLYFNASTSLGRMFHEAPLPPRRGTDRFR